MKTRLLILILASGVGGKLIAQTSSYLAINLPPVMGSALEIGYERNRGPGLTLELYGGYVDNSTIDSPLKVLTAHRFSRRSGFFVMPGARFNLRRDPGKFSPFAGLHLVNSVAVEQGIYRDFPGYEAGNEFSRNSYNLGFTGMIGVTSPSTTRIGIDLGLRVGKLIVNNLIDVHSHMPGMGVDTGDGFRSYSGRTGKAQVIARIRYRLE